MNRYLILLFIGLGFYFHAISDPTKNQEEFKTGSVIKVPEDCKTIQQAIDTAQNGDTVLVADGIYTGEGNRDIDFRGKAIVVRSENGYENCIIDCQGSEGDYHYGFFFRKEESRNSVLEGFTIKNGWLIQTDCMEEDGSGGGILIYSSPTIRNNKIINNRASFGAGIHSEGSPLIVENIIESNEAARWGGGLSLNGKETVMGNIICENVAKDGGGGIFSRQSGIYTTIVNNIIKSNRSFGNGGGISLDITNSFVITGNFIVDNEASVYGGGVYLSQTVGENVFKIYNNTIVGNNAREGGGIYNHNIADTITNCVFYLNSPQDISNCNLTYCCIKDEVQGVGNIHEDPVFITVNDILWINDSSSPCVNAGNPDTTGLFFTWKDILGNERIIDNRIDIGANELDKKAIPTIANESDIVSDVPLVYPVPANTKISLRYVIPYTGEISITIYSSSGIQMASLIDSKINKGVYEESFDISSFSRGIYFLKFRFNNVEKIIKIPVE